MARALIALAVTAAAFVATPALAATHRETYAPIDADGTLRDGLQVNLGGTPGDCWTYSSMVGGTGVFRCFEGNLIRDPCYLDTRDTGDLNVLCVGSPWARTAIRLPLLKRPKLPGRPMSRSTAQPWALELAAGARCTFATGATTTYKRLRLNYFCGRFGTSSARYLFGSPDRSRATWRIGQSRSVSGRGLRKVAIAVAWK